MLEIGKFPYFDRKLQLPTYVGYLRFEYNNDGTVYYYHGMDGVEESRQTFAEVLRLF
jgi:hypothetical protein